MPVAPASAVMSQKIRIVMIDDHSLFRESLGRLLESEPDLDVVGGFASPSEAQATLVRQHVDILLLDYDLGEGQGISAVQRVIEEGFAGRVLLVTAGISDIEMVRALKDGASGVFLKHNPPGQLVEAIHRAMRGEIWLDNRSLQALVAGITTEDAGKQPFAGTLQARERNVLSGVFEGLTNKEIAARLQLSENSVKWVLQQLFATTGARTRSQLVRIAFERYGKDWMKASSAEP